MKKLLALAVIVVLVASVTVLATPAPKVFVCKYVGTPGTDERLQTGQNPISVSSNAIKNYQGVGSYFNDKHGRSYVLAEDNGQSEPDVSECPKADKPDDPVVPPATPPVTPPTTPPAVNTPSPVAEETKVEGQGK